MAQWVKPLLYKSDGLALNPQIHVEVEGENRPTELCSGFPVCPMARIAAHTHPIYIQNDNVKIKTTYRCQ